MDKKKILLYVIDMIKKKLFIFLWIAIILMTSCSISTFSLIADENNPPELNASILFLSSRSTGRFKVLSWNGIDIEERLYGQRSFFHYERAYTDGNRTILFVPAGINRITFNMMVDYGDAQEGSSYTSRNILLEYNFEAGKEYTVEGKIVESFNYRLTIRGMTRNPIIQLFIHLYDTTSRKTLVKQFEVPISLF